MARRLRPTILLLCKILPHNNDNFIVRPWRHNIINNMTREIDLVFSILQRGNVKTAEL